MSVRVRSALAEAARERRYVQISGRSGVQVSGFVLDVGDALVLLAKVHDLSFDGYEVVRLSAIDKVRRSAVDEFFEGMIRGAGEAIPADPGLGSLTAMGAVLRGIGERWSVVGIEHEDDALEDALRFRVGAILGADDLRVRLRYITTTGHFRGVEVITTHQITSVAFGAPYYDAFARAARPWSDAPWGDALAAALGRVWSPLSGLLAVLGEAREGLRFRRLCASYDLEELVEGDDVSTWRCRSYGLAVTLGGERVAAIDLYTQPEGGFEPFVGPFLDGLELEAGRDEVGQVLGSSVVDDTCRIGPIAARFVYDEEGRLERLRLEHVDDG
ncbi:MAG: hypothetical protein H6710_21275 [Myxococcales bacterium]|nr:hypothetical protein [Myxococcales bacterium]MCB9700521.1 hypothetical protein [Myxococcales bacterium]